MRTIDNSPESDDDGAKKGKRGPGRPRSSNAYTKTITLRLTEAQATQLTELAETNGCDRSDVIRAAMADGVLITTSATQAATYRQLVTLHTTAKELACLPTLGQAGQMLAGGLIDRIEFLLQTLQEAAQ